MEQENFCCFFSCVKEMLSLSLKLVCKLGIDYIVKASQSSLSMFYCPERHGAGRVRIRPLSKKFVELVSSYEEVLGMSVIPKAQALRLGQVEPLEIHPWCQVAVQLAQSLHNFFP